jgi:hypothetical protein
MRWLQASSFLDGPAGLEPEAFTEADVLAAPVLPADRTGGDVDDANDANDADDYASYSVTYHLDRQQEHPPAPLPTARPEEHADPSSSRPFDHAFAFAGWIEDEPTEPGFALPVPGEPSLDWAALDAGWEAAV